MQHACTKCNTRYFSAQGAQDCSHSHAHDRAPTTVLAALKVARAEIHNPGAFRNATGADIGEYMDAAIRAAEGR